MNILEAAQEYLDNIKNGAEYFYSEEYDNYRYKFDRYEILIQKIGDEEWTSANVTLLIRDFKRDDWHVHYAEPKLKPCPFCSSSQIKLTTVFVHDSGAELLGIWCPGCGLNAYRHACPYKVAAAWNRRDGGGE